MSFFAPDCRLDCLLPSWETSVRPEIAPMERFQGTRPGKPVPEGRMRRNADGTEPLARPSPVPARGWSTFSHGEKGRARPVTGAPRSNDFNAHSPINTLRRIGWTA